MTVSPAAIKPSGGDYTLLSSFEASLPATFTQLQQADVYNYGSGGMSDSVAWTGFTMTSSFRLVVSSPTGQRHNGTPHSGAYMTSGGATTFSCGSGANYVTIDFFEIEATTSSFGPVHYPPGAASTANSFNIKHSIIHGPNGGVGGSSTSNLNLTFSNSLIYSTGATRILDTRGANSCLISDDIIYTQGGDFAVLGDGNCTVQGTYVGGSSSLDMWNTFGILGSFNSTSDATATSINPGTNSINSVPGASAFTSVTSGSENFTTKTGFTTFTNAGTTISGITDDIIGTPRGLNPDLGAFQNIITANTNKLLLNGATP